ncbi:glutaredoxin [Bacillus manliponensis]|uniref:Glutaredoxin n=1 Tax=Bacillus manliponensis TaxID=574376 RepID=A0A073K1R2_9BACI|nr:glutaredoxin family protein [Bacillus manliponensis]KEK21279.1 glutaredoxin [Bacillus manliponensis]
MDVVLYGKHDCCLCEEAKEVLQELTDEFSLHIKEVNIYEDDELLEKYQIMIPVVEIDGKEVAYGIIHKSDIIQHINNIVKS